MTSNRYTLFTKNTPSEFTQNEYRDFLSNQRQILAFLKREITQLRLNDRLSNKGDLSDSQFKLIYGFMIAGLLVASIVQRALEEEKKGPESWPWSCNFSVIFNQNSGIVLYFLTLAGTLLSISLASIWNQNKEKTIRLDKQTYTQIQSLCEKCCIDPLPNKGKYSKQELENLYRELKTSTVEKIYIKQKELINKSFES